MSGDIFTLDADNNAAVRTVSVNAGASETNSPVIFTTDENGNAAVRVMGGAGSVNYDEIIIKSDTIPAASEEEAGKFYCYSGETNQSFAHGYVYECIAGSTTYDGSVTFEPATLSGTVVTATAGALSSLCAEYIQADITTITNGTMTFDAAGELWAFVGKDTENNTVGHFQIYQQDYVDAGFVFTGTPQDGDVIAFTCSISESTSYSWERIDLQPAAKLGRYLSGWNCATGLATTNPQESPYEYTTGDYFIVSAVAAAGGTNYRPNGSSYVIGQASTTVESSVVTINDTYLYDGTNWTLLKTGSAVTSVNGQVGAVTITGDDVLPTQTGNSGRVLGTDGFVAGWVEPEIVQRSTMPQASEEEVDKIYQFTGTTDANYTNGYFYKCVSDGQDPATYSWEQVNVMPAGSSLPDQTGNSGKFLTTDGTDASWSDKPLVNQATGYDSFSPTILLGSSKVETTCVGINSSAGGNAIRVYDGSAYGYQSIVKGAFNTAIGAWCAAGNGDGSASTQYNGNVALGYRVSAGANISGTHDAIIIGSSRSNVSNEESDTFKIVRSDGVLTVINANGKIPASLLTNAATSPATMPTLAVADWSLDSGTNKYTQSVSVTGVTGTNTVFVSPAPSSAADYASSSVLCISQTTDSLTFQADSVPSNAITVNVVIIGA